MRLRYKVVNGKHIYDRGDYDYYKIYRPQKRQRASGYKQLSAYERYEKIYLQKVSIRYGQDIYETKLTKEEFEDRMLFYRNEAKEKHSKFTPSKIVLEIVKSQRRWSYKVQKRLEAEAVKAGIDIAKLWKTGSADIERLGGRSREYAFLQWAENMIASGQVDIGDPKDKYSNARDLFEEMYY